MVGAMGGKLALLYLIIIGAITLSYTADLGRMKRTISALAVARVQGPAEKSGKLQFMLSGSWRSVDRTVTRGLGD